MVIRVSLTEICTTPFDWPTPKYPWFGANTLRVSLMATMLEKFKRTYLGNGSSDPLHVWLGGGFVDGGSNGPISGSIKSTSVAILEISNQYISGMGYPIHFHEIDSSFTRIWGRIMLEE